MQTKAKSHLHFPKVWTDGIGAWPRPQAHSSFVPALDNPTSFTEANKFLEWHQAMQVEFGALLTNQTRTIVPLSPTHNLVWCCWIYKTKHLSDGCIEHHKAHLVAKGDNQLEGLDYLETFSPVVKPTTIWLVLLLLCPLLGWKCFLTWSIGWKCLYDTTLRFNSPPIPSLYLQVKPCPLWS